MLRKLLKKLKDVVVIVVIFITIMVLPLIAGVFTDSLLHFIQVIIDAV